MNTFPPTAGGPGLAARLANLRAVLLDVDGVLTDGRLLYGPGGDERREFSVRDGLAIRAAAGAGLLVGLITGRRTEAVAAWARDLGIGETWQGQRDKEASWNDILGRHGLRDAEACYMGDDLLDLPLLARAGLAAAPADACQEVLAAAHFVSGRAGGQGCVRDLIERILRPRGAWPPTRPGDSPGPPA